MFARAPFIARDLNVGHCFETLVVGHVLGTIVFCYRECFDACIIQLEQRTVMRRSLLYAALSHNDSENTMLALSCVVLGAKPIFQQQRCAPVRNLC